MISRRRWIERVAESIGVALALPLTPRRLFAAEPKRVLVLGGTSFLGPMVVEALMIAGHTVTLFNRGITNPQLFPQLERLRGFRDPDPAQENFDALGRRKWDAIIDVWPNDPAVAENAGRGLRDRTNHYVYVSSIAAYTYATLANVGVTETAPTLPWDPKIAGYNRGKAESERRLAAVFGERLTVVRPGPIKGMRDTALDLFTWLRRMELPGPHIGPGTGTDASFQFADVRDVGDFIALSIARNATGTYNLAGKSYTFRDYLASCAAAVDTRQELVWIDRDYLTQHGAAPVSDWTGPFPDWHPAPNRPEGFYRVSSDRAFAAGWIQRPFRDTARDCLAFTASTDPGFQSYVDPLPASREQELIRSWRARL